MKINKYGELTDEGKAILRVQNWFDNFYRPQVEQAQRAERTKTAWLATDGEKEYKTLAELDAEANRKQSEIRALKAELSAPEGME
jgi:hypothetical protein